VIAGIFHLPLIRGVYLGVEGGYGKAFPEPAGTGDEVRCGYTCKLIDITGFIDIQIIFPDNFLKSCIPIGSFFMASLLQKFYTAMEK